MTDNEMRIAIAEACGWQDVVAYDDGKVIGLPPGFTEDQCPEGADEDLPDYLNDLNAMHEAEKVLDDAQCRAYNEALSKICIPMSALFPPFPERRCEMYLFHATARQRAEAFLRMVGKWKETPASYYHPKDIK